jgi:hypothetical protein
MQEYRVLIPHEWRAAGDTVKLNPRQAKYLLLSGHIQVKAAVKAKAEK